ncbi:unnamed protein product, partial [Adineta steineri]
MDAGSVDTHDTPDAHKSEVLNSETESTHVPVPEATQEDNDEENKDTEQDEGQEDLNNNDSQDIIQKPEADSPPRLPDTFYYEAEEIHAKPVSTDEKVFSQNTLSMYRSFGYDCNKR